jgi:hypothetical protein
VALIDLTEPYLSEPTASGRAVSRTRSAELVHTARWRPRAFLQQYAGYCGPQRWGTARHRLLVQYQAHIRDCPEGQQMLAKAGYKLSRSVLGCLTFG